MQVQQKMTTYSPNNRDWEDFKMKLEYLKDSLDSRYLVESLGGRITRETSKELRGYCYIHGGDNPTSFRFNKERKTWVCFSHKCHEIFGNDVIGLIKASLKTDFKGAVSYLERIAGASDSAADYAEYQRRREREKFIQMTRQHSIKSPHKEVTEDRLACYRNFKPLLFLRDGFSQDTLDYFEIGSGYVDEDGLAREVIPIRDEFGNLVAYSLRDVREEADYESKYKITYGFDKDKVLYNFQNFDPELGYIILVEGFKSVWRLYDYGIYNVVACMGSKITPGQINLLIKREVRKVITMFDGDIAGYSGTEDAYEKLVREVDEVVPIFITEVDENGKGLDPSDLDKDTILNYLKGVC